MVNVCDECGRCFGNSGALFNHQRSRCKASKRGFKEVLSDAKRYWERRTKRPRKTAAPEESTPSTFSNLEEPAFQTLAVNDSNRADEEVLQHGESQNELETPRISPRSTSPTTTEGSRVATVREEPQVDSHMNIDTEPTSVPLRRSGRLRNVVAAPHRETSPEPPAPVAPQVHISTPTTVPLQIRSSWSENARPHKTSSNQFGLYREFFGLGLPNHDPDSVMDIQELCDGPLDSSFDDSVDEVDNAPQDSNDTQLYYPYPNRSSFELSEWFWSGQFTNSLARFNALVKVVGDPDFDPADVRSTNWAKLHRLLPHAKAIALEDACGKDDDWVDDTHCDWVESEVAIDVPFPTQGRGPSEARFHAGVLHHRKILSVIKEKLQDPQEHPYRHYTPYKMLWQPGPSFDPIRVHGELYTSEEFLKVDQEVQQLNLGTEDEGLERVVLALMFWTDSTLLANFGTAKLWPCYMFFGNDSKYRRAKPSTNLCNHVAYFEPLPESFKDWYRSHNNGKSPSADLITHCNRELFHEQWRLLLDEELLEAMQRGIKICCPDGVTRLIFPRIFTYSADYPEKVTIATIRSLGTYPCPRCLVKKTDMNQAGTDEDKLFRAENQRLDTDERQEAVKAARAKIYEEGYAVSSKFVHDELKSQSLVPTTNAFSKVTACVQFDIFSSLVVDLMHEFELGVWRTLFTHLIRILEAEDRIAKRSLVNELDRRYREMSPFGVDTIRKFRSNASEMKRLGARDYENLLQCAIPAFKGLLPPKHDAIVCRLLFLCAEWHALAKLRMHTDETLELLTKATDAITNQFRLFIQETCSAYDTRETSKEYSARLKRLAKGTKMQPSQGPLPGGGAVADPVPPSILSNPASPLPPADNHLLPPITVPQNGPMFVRGSAASIHNAVPAISPQPSQSVVQGPSAPAAVASGLQNQTNSQMPDPKGKLRKSLNINTYKYHALCDYVDTIRRFGTTDSYTSERGELEHKLPKSWYLRTDKRDYKVQLAKIERRRANIRKIRLKMRCARTEPSQLNTSSRYRLSQAKNCYEPLSNYIHNSANCMDPALKDFLPKLQRHLLPRIKTALRERQEKAGLPSTLDVSDPSDWSYVVLQNHRLHVHKILRLRYTTYDVRRDEDIVRPSTHKANVMLLNPAYLAGDSDQHPYLYARVLRIFHAQVQFVGSGNIDFKPVRLDFLFVRWYLWDGSRVNTNGGLDELSLPPVTDPEAFGFVDPEDVVRACHILPQFHIHHAPNAEDISSIAKDSKDYPAYVLIRFADRDMYMRFQWGYGVGHRYSHLFRQRPGMNTNVETIVQEQQPLPSGLDPTHVQPALGESAGEEEMEEGSDDRLGEDDMVWEPMDEVEEAPNSEEEDEGEGDEEE